MYLESKHWNLKELRSTSIFQNLENHSTKVDGGTNNTQDFEKTMEFTVHLEQNRPETEKPPILQVTKLKISEPEFKFNPPSKCQPVNPHAKFPTNFDRRSEETVSKQNPTGNLNQARYPNILERKTEEVAKANAFRTAKEQLVLNYLIYLYF